MLEQKQHCLSRLQRIATPPMSTVPYQNHGRSRHTTVCGQHMSTLHLVDKVLGLCFRSAWLVAFVPGRMPFQESQQSQPSKTSSPRRYHKILTDAVAALEATAESSEIVCIRIYRLMQKPSIQSQNYEPRLKTIENCKIG